MQSEAREDGLDFKIKKISAADEYTGALTDDGTLFVWGKNDKGQLGVGSGVGIDMIESENLPKEVEFSRAFREKPEAPVFIKDFSTGTNTMLAIDSEDRVYKTGFKIDYDPTLVKFDGGMLEKAAVKKLKCGERHHVVIDRTNNRLHCTTGVFKEKSTDQHDGFKVYDADDLFDQGKVLEISMKYDTFGAIVEN
jgi:alpha-tubulin suppressor-like RCC1 family protein